MGPVSLVAYHRQKLDLSLLLHFGLGDKLGTKLRIGQLACCGLCRELFFSGAVGSVQIYQRLMKGCHVRGLPVGSVRRAYVDWRKKRTCHVDQVFPCRVYIDSNHRDSQMSNRYFVTAIK
jgi:hypothetical protein